MRKFASFHLLLHLKETDFPSISEGGRRRRRKRHLFYQYICQCLREGATYVQEDDSTSISAVCLQIHPPLLPLSKWWAFVFARVRVCSCESIEVARVSTVRTKYNRNYISECTVRAGERTQQWNDRLLTIFAHTHTSTHTDTNRRIQRPREAKHESQSSPSRSPCSPVFEIIVPFWVICC